MRNHTGVKKKKLSKLYIPDQYLSDASEVSPRRDCHPIPNYVLIPYPPQHFTFPTNIASVNLVISCNKDLSSTIPTPALAFQRCISDVKTLSQLKCRPPAPTATIVATETVHLTMPILVG